MEMDQSLEVTRRKLDAISPSFCSAKWLQVTLHLQNGQTHSCHHPKTHRVPIDELETNSTALHNTKFKKNVRREMQSGKRPQECQYCWNMEDLGPHIHSDRHIKSNDSWAAPSLEEISKLPWDADITPTYVEVSFSNTCNFKCAYCLPHISSKWMSEIQQYGPYPTYLKHNNLKHVAKSGLMPLPSEDENPYIEAFWKWWPELYPTLKVFRITGGEPLLSPNTFRVLDYIIENPNPSLDLAINSNMGVPASLIEKFEKKIKIIMENKAVRHVQVYTSIDTWGRQAEYIRNGLDLELFKKNLDLHFSINKNVPVTIMCAFNILSVFNFQELIDFVSIKRAEGQKILLDISYVHHPLFLDCRLLPDSLKRPGTKLLESMKSRNFHRYEIIKMSRLVEFLNSSLDEKELRRQRSEFAVFIKEHDRRRKTNFLETFPEFQKDFEEWSRIKRGLPIKYYLFKPIWFAKHVFQTLVNRFG